MEASLNETQSQSNHKQLTWDDFVYSTDQTKMNLTYQVLVDLMGINSADLDQPSSQASAQNIQEAKQKLLPLYVDKIKAIEEHFEEIKQKDNERQIKKLQLEIEDQEFDQSLIRSQELFNLQQSLNEQLKQNLSDMQQFIQSVATRIKHQRYLDNQTQINSYIQRQKAVFEDNKHDLTTLINNHNEEVKDKYIKVALNICKQKQAEINRLKQSTESTKDQLESTRQQIQRMNQDQVNICRKNLQLSERVLQIKAYQQARVRQAKKQSQHKKPQSDVDSQPSNNLVSQIMPSRSSIQQSSVISVPEIGEEQPKPSTRCEIPSTDLKTQLQANKILIIFAFLVTAIVSLL